MNMVDMIAIAVVLFLAILTTDAYGQDDCEWSWCDAPTASPSLVPEPTERFKIRDKDRLMVGDIYNPGHGRRLQIRDKDRHIIGYIEADGRITDTDRQTIGNIDDLGDGE